MSTVDLGLPTLGGLDLVPTAEDVQKAKDYVSDQEVRWCPGCGDYAVLAAVRSFLPTGKGAHGVYQSRNGSELYVSNRDEGTISVLDAATLAAKRKWTIPGGGSPDMGGVTADGTQLWLSGRSNKVVYVFDTSTGALLKKIPVGLQPHGLCVWPQPGRFSLGHTGNLR